MTTTSTRKAQANGKGIWGATHEKKKKKKRISIEGKAETAKEE